MSTLSVSNITDGTDTVETGYVVNGSAKAWAHVDQETSASSVKDSLNVSSITDNGNAETAINFSSNWGNVYYSFSFGVCNGGNWDDTATLNVENSQLPNVYSFNFYSFMNAALNPAKIAAVTFHGDLA